MRFMMTFQWKPDSKTRAEAIERFKRTGGQPPRGAKLLGRWTKADLSGGFDLLECDDVKPLTEFALMWSDLMRLEMTPVADDAELSAALDGREPAHAAK